MQIVRYAGGPYLLQDDGLARELPSASVAELLRLREDELRRALQSAAPSRGRTTGKVLAPIDGLTEVWAAGVTYRRSEEARVEESDTPDIYSRVYAAERPELF